jgi:hypothetical protein
MRRSPARAPLSPGAARSARVSQRVVPLLTGDDGAATPPAAHRLLVDPQAARGPRADDAMVEQDANHIAREQAVEFDPRLARYPWHRNSVEIIR